MIKHKLTQEQINYNKGVAEQINKSKGKTQELTLSVVGVAKNPVFKGFRVLVGHKKGGGMFEYSVGSKDKARKLGEQMKVICKNMLFKRQRIFITLEPCELKKCDISYCEKVCESDERYCMKCEDLMYDARQEVENE